jgi:hypothetical protein
LILCISAILILENFYTYKIKQQNELTIESQSGVNHNFKKSEFGLCGITALKSVVRLKW